jgi:hypothetical protein
VQFDAAVRYSLEHEHLSSNIARTQAKISEIEARNADTFEKALVRAGINPVAEDPDSVERYVALKDYIKRQAGDELALGTVQRAVREARMALGRV